MTYSCYGNNNNNDKSIRRTFHTTSLFIDNYPFAPSVTPEKNTHATHLSPLHTHDIQCLYYTQRLSPLTNHPPLIIILSIIVTTSSTTMTDMMPEPTSRSTIPRNDSFSVEDITKAFKASASKSKTSERQYRIADSNVPTVPPPSRSSSRPASIYGAGGDRRG